MEAKITVADLQKALATVAPAVSGRNTLPILSHVLISAFPDEIKVMAYNLEISITDTEAAQVRDAGGICVPFKTFNDWVRAMGKTETVSLSINDATMTLEARCGKFDSSFKGMSTDEFPMVQASQTNALSLDPEDLKTFLEQTWFAAATDEARPVLTGVLLEFAGDSLVGSAADGFRLSRSKINGSALPSSRQLIIPRTAVHTLLKIIRQSDVDLVELYLPPEDGGTSTVLFRVGNVEMSTSQIIEGKFPDVDQIIPKTSTKQIRLPADTLLQAVQSARLFSVDSNIITLVVEGDRMTITAVSPETGDFVTELPVDFETDENEPLVFGLNCAYIADVLKVQPSGDALIRATSPNSPFVFQADGDDSFLHIIMPMHVQTAKG